MQGIAQLVGNLVKGLLSAYEVLIFSLAFILIIDYELDKEQDLCKIGEPKGKYKKITKRLWEIVSGEKLE